MLSCTSVRRVSENVRSLLIVLLKRSGRVTDLQYLLYGTPQWRQWRTPETTPCEDTHEGSSRLELVRLRVLAAVPLSRRGTTMTHCHEPTPSPRDKASAKSDVYWRDLGSGGAIKP